MTNSCMQKFANNPGDMVDDSIKGFVKCYSDIVTFTESNRVLKHCDAPVAGKVGIVTGGGSGHDPALIGYIGRNMVDTVAAGDIFTTPTVNDCYIALKNADAGKGVACLFGNYKNDIVNFQKAIKLAEKEGITVKTVIANDDVAIPEKKNRRGIAGEILMWKVGGAAASLGYDLDRVIKVSKKAINATRSIGVGLSSCIIPKVGRPNYLIESGTMEIGIGHHGTSSLDTCKLKSADATVDIMMDAILGDMPYEPGEEAAVMISGMGNTMLMELHILYNRVYDILENCGVKIYHSYVGNYFTSLDMMGVNLTLMKMDDELKKMLDVPVYTAAFNHFHIK